MNHNGFLMVIHLCVFSGEHILLILEGKIHRSIWTSVSHLGPYTPL